MITEKPIKTSFNTLLAAPDLADSGRNTGIVTIPVWDKGSRKTIA
jgi:hypothetical protein